MHCASSNVAWLQLMNWYRCKLQQLRPAVRHITESVCKVTQDKYENKLLTHAGRQSYKNRKGLVPTKPLNSDILPNRSNWLATQWQLDFKLCPIACPNGLMRKWTWKDQLLVPWDGIKLMTCMSAAFWKMIDWSQVAGLLHVCDISPIVYTEFGTSVSSGETKFT
jgi:hypothetical protein